MFVWAAEPCERFYRRTVLERDSQRRAINVSLAHRHCWGNGRGAEKSLGVMGVGQV